MRGLLDARMGQGLPIHQVDERRPGGGEHSAEQPRDAAGDDECAARRDGRQRFGRMPEQQRAQHDADAEDQAQDLVGGVGEPGQQDRAGDRADDACRECRPQRRLQSQRPAPVEERAGGGRDDHRHRIDRVDQRNEIGRPDEAEQDQRQCKTGEVLGIDRERDEYQEQQVGLHRKGR